jgi:hypothetical protein
MKRYYKKGCFVGYCKDTMAVKTTADNIKVGIDLLKEALSKVLVVPKKNDISIQTKIKVLK